MDVIPQKRVLKLRFNNGTLASQQYTEGDEAGRLTALTYLMSLKSKWVQDAGLENVTIEDWPLEPLTEARRWQEDQR